MRSTLSNLSNMFRVPDLRNKVLFTLSVIIIYRLGANIPCPGIDFSQVQVLTQEAKSGGSLGFLNLLSGGALTIAVRRRRHDIVDPSTRPGV